MQASLYELSLSANRRASQTSFHEATNERTAREPLTTNKRYSPSAVLRIAINPKNAPDAHEVEKLVSQRGTPGAKCLSTISRMTQRFGIGTYHAWLGMCRRTCYNNDIVVRRVLRY